MDARSLQISGDCAKSLTPFKPPFNRLYLKSCAMQMDARECR